MKATRFAVIAIALVALVTMLVYLVMFDDAASPATSPDSRSAQVPAAPVRVATPPPMPAGPPQQLAVANVQQTREQYLAGAVYPPWSAPATPAWKSFIEWNAPRERVDDSVVEDDGGKMIRASLTLDRLYARPGEPIEGTLTLWRDDRDGVQTAIDFEAVGAVQIWDQATYDAEKWDRAARTPGYTSVWEHRFEAVPGKKNQRRIRFTPSEIEALETQASARFLATMAVTGKGGGQAMKPLELDFQYAREEPIVVIAKVGDRIEDGSLVVDFDVDVRVAAPIKVESTLFDAERTKPIAVYQDFWRPERTGKHTFSVRFFGRALVEAGIPGPYALSVHGFALRFDQEPAELHWRDDRVFVTAPYRVDQFSADEWQDPLKDDMLATYDRLEHGFSTGSL
jgi:hypothetical protein